MENIFINGISLEEYIKENYVAKDKIKEVLESARYDDCQDDEYYKAIDFIEMNLLGENKNVT